MALWIWTLVLLVLSPLGAGCDRESAGSRAQSELPGGGDPAPTYLATRSPTHDFGEVWEGTVLEHEFALKVMGTEDLRVTEVSADCGCTIPSLQAAETEEGERRAYANGTPLAPGSWLFLHVRYDTRGKLGSTPRNVHVTGNLPGGETRVLLQARVRRWLAVEPPRVDLPELFVEDRTETRFVVRSSEDSPFLLRHTQLGVPPQVQVELAPREPDGEGRSAVWDVLVKLGPDLPLGSHGYPIQLVSDVPNPNAGPGEDGKQPFFTAMPFVGLRVVGVVSVTPGRMTFGMIQPGETVSRTLRITSNDPGFELGEPSVRLEPMRPGDAFPLGKTARISTRPVEGENAWDVQLLFSELDPAVTRTFLARLSIATGNPEQPSIQVPVTGFRLRPTDPGGQR